jgi:sugar lactone lactonase YvrE
MKEIFKNCSVAYAAANLLGEGPVWNEKTSCLLWVDIEIGVLHEISWPKKAVRTWKMPQPAGMVALQQDGNAIIALQEGLVHINVNSGNISWLLQLEKQYHNNRANDGKCDVKGRLWLGTMNFNCTDPTGALYLIDKNLRVTKKLQNLTIPNGMAWSKDNKRMYFIDSATFKVDAYMFDQKTGEIVFERTAIKMSEELGMPDGMTIDERGMLWIAHWGGFCVRCWNPETGEQLAAIQIPAPQVTSATFGGKNMDELFITTARTGMQAIELEKYPLSGHLFHIKLPVKGLPANRCNLSLNR